jgi:hypothetical protein
MRVSVGGELFATAVRVLGWVNGFAQPVFSEAERLRILAECVRLGWDSPNGDYDGTPSHLVGWVRLPGGEWLVEGWAWDSAEVGA